MLCDTPGQQLRYSSVISSRHLAMAHLPRQRPPSPSLWNLDTPGCPSAALAAPLEGHWALWAAWTPSHSAILLQLWQSQSFNSCLLPLSPNAEQGTHPNASQLFPCWPIDLVSRFTEQTSNQALFHSRHKTWSIWNPTNHYSFLFLTHTQPSHFPGVPLPASMLSMRDYTFLQVWPRFRLTHSAQCYQLGWSSA